MESWRSMILLSSRFFKREKERIYWVHSILRYREEGEFPLLIKEQRDYHRRLKVYFRMSVAQFDALPQILELHIKKRTTNFCELSVQGSSQYYVLRDESQNLHSGFWCSLLRWIWIVKTPLKMLPTNAENRKLNPIQFFFMTDETFRGFFWHAKISD